MTEEQTQFIDDMTSTIFTGLMHEMKKKKYKEKIIKTVVEPIINDINDRYYPHMMTLVSLLILIILLLVILIIVDIKK
jgi:hypothetical protein